MGLLAHENEIERDVALHGLHEEIASQVASEKRGVQNVEVRGEVPDLFCNSGCFDSVRVGLGQKVNEGDGVRGGGDLGMEEARVR
ncbi:hypothetical protein ACOSQ3_007212 [Xanthoceras sorbifolium]